MTSRFVCVFDMSSNMESKIGGEREEYNSVRPFFSFFSLERVDQSSFVCQKCGFKENADLDAQEPVFAWGELFYLKVDVLRM